jgi:glycerophosphoryl diester phosphodiesterase
METAVFPWRIAHRGARREAPDNTAAAFTKAMTYPIDGIEFDVQMSADGCPILYHDRTLWRLARRRERVSRLKLRDLQHLDWGAWFGPEHAGEQLLTLQDALRLLAPCPRLLVEIKSNPRDRQTGHVRRLTRTVVSTMKRAEHGFRKDRIYVLSFDPEVLAQARTLAPEFRYVLNSSDAVPPAYLPASLTRHFWAVDIRIGKLSDDWARWAQSLGLHLMTYTCNTRPQVRKALSMGVHAIISDRPGWLADCLSTQAGSGS